jgi:hypothetical protein
MYLDCDTTPPLRSRNLSVKTIDAAKRRAFALLEGATEGQIAIYRAYLGEFLGYAIKLDCGAPFFEEATDQ